MGELSHVSPGQEVESAHVNAAYDRVISWYTDATQRTSLAPTPADGEPSWLQDQDRLEISDGSIWRYVLTGDDTGVYVVENELRLTASGSAADPELTWDGDGDSGIRWLASNRWAMVAGGADMAEVNSTGLTAGQTTGYPMLRKGLSAASPGYTFWGDTNTGIVWLAANAFGLVAGGAIRIRLQGGDFYPETDEGRLIGGKLVHVTGRYSQEV